MPIGVVEAGVGVILHPAKIMSTCGLHDSNELILKPDEEAHRETLPPLT